MCPLIWCEARTASEREAGCLDSEQEAKCSPLLRSEGYRREASWNWWKFRQRDKTLFKERHVGGKILLQGILSPNDQFMGGGDGEEKGIFGSNVLCSWDDQRGQQGLRN